MAYNPTDVELRLRCADLAVRVLPTTQDGTKLKAVMNEIYTFVTNAAAE